MLYEGTFREGRRHGPGILIDKFNQTVADGVFGQGFFPCHKTFTWVEVVSLNRLRLERRTKQEFPTSKDDKQQFKVTKKPTVTSYRTKMQLRNTRTILSLTVNN